MERKTGKLGILVGGGPAPGINSVIAAATIRANLKGVEVLGIYHGFRSIMKGITSDVGPLTIDQVSRIHFRGGSKLGTARANPTTDVKFLDNTLEALRELGVDRLITIGGDDTAFSALKLEEYARGTIQVVHVPKTIDNDLDLPHGVNTFGYQTARHVGAGIAKNLMIDARTTGRWYVVISMGRKAGHLALGVGKAAGATLTVIPEEFPLGPIPLRHIVDVLVGAIIKRLSQKRGDGVAILAEGLMERLPAEDLEGLEDADRDAHGHIRLGEIQFARVVKNRLEERLDELGIEMPITAKDIGYELRGAEPIPYDMEYTRDLGFCAAQFIINGGTAAMVSIDDGRFKPLYFKDMLDESTGRTRVRMVDIESEYYHIARRYMIRLNKRDFANDVDVAMFAHFAGLSPEKFRKQFSYLVEEDRLTQIRQHQSRKEPSVEDVTSDVV